MPTTDSHFPRAASLTRATSLAQRSALRNAVTGTLSLVSLSTITAMPVPQLGWHPQLNWPQSACGPWVRSLPVSYTHLRAHETRHDLVCRLLLEKKKKYKKKN